MGNIGLNKALFKSPHDKRDLSQSIRAYRDDGRPMTLKQLIDEAINQNSAGVRNKRGRRKKKDFVF